MWCNTCVVHTSEPTEGDAQMAGIASHDPEAFAAPGGALRLFHIFPKKEEIYLK